MAYTKKTTVKTESEVKEKIEDNVASVKETPTVKKYDKEDVIPCKSITNGKLLVDGSVYDSVDELLNDIDTLVKKIEENPKKYLKISVF